MRKLIAILMALGLLRGCSYIPDGGMTYHPDIPGVELRPESEPSSEYTLDLSRTRCPQVLSVTIENGDDPYLRNLLDIHVLHTGVVGLFGCPVEVEGTTGNSKLIFRYDPDDMRNVPARNLIGLYYNENSEYEELKPTLDEEAHTVSFDIDSDGAYMLVDLYEWYKAWGADLPEYAHPLEMTFEGGYYPSFYPSFDVTVPEGTSLNFSSDMEWTNPETGLVSKDYFSSKNGSRLNISAKVIRGEGAWADALAGANYVRSNPSVEGLLLWNSMEELAVEPKRIVLLKNSTFTGKEIVAASCYYYVSPTESVSMEVYVPAGDAELEKELREFVLGIRFYDSDFPWDKNT